MAEDLVERTQDAEGIQATSIYSPATGTKIAQYLEQVEIHRASGSSCTPCGASCSSCGYRIRKSA